jgi:hypothetical protein
MKKWNMGEVPPFHHSSASTAATEVEVVPRPVISRLIESISTRSFEILDPLRLGISSDEGETGSSLESGEKVRAELSLLCPPFGSSHFDLKVKLTPTNDHFLLVLFRVFHLILENIPKICATVQ